MKSNYVLGISQTTDIHVSVLTNAYNYVTCTHPKKQNISVTQEGALKPLASDSLHHPSSLPTQLLF